MADNISPTCVPQQIEGFELKALQVLHAEFTKIKAESEKLGAAVNSYVTHLLAKLGIDNTNGDHALDLNTGTVVKTNLGTQAPIKDVSIPLPSSSIETA